MPARTGEAYITGLRERAAEVYICGERVKDVTTHPAFRNGVRTIASLYDMQHDPTLQEAMTYLSPTTGERVGLSFIIPRTAQDLERRHTMMAHWARATCGMTGRSPDFMNVAVTSMAAASDYCAQNRPEFKQHIQQYYEYIREHDLVLPVHYIGKIPWIIRTANRCHKRHPFPQHHWDTLRISHSRIAGSACIEVR